MSIYMYLTIRQGTQAFISTVSRQCLSCTYHESVNQFVNCNIPAVAMNISCSLSLEDHHQLIRDCSHSLKYECPSGMSSCVVVGWLAGVSTPVTLKQLAKWILSELVSARCDILSYKSAGKMHLHSPTPCPPQEQVQGHIPSILSTISIRFPTCILISRHRTDRSFSTPNRRAITLTEFTFPTAFVFLGVFICVSFNVFFEMVGSYKSLVTRGAGKPLLTWKYIEKKSDKFFLSELGVRMNVH